MTTIDPVSPPLSLHARIEERILAPLRRNSAARTWFVITVAAILALHGAVLLALLLRDRTPQTQMAQETPVEIVVEQPPAPPKQPEPPKPQPQKQTEIEKAASSAPRAPNDAKVETSALDKETHAPKAPTPPSEGQPTHDSAAAPPSSEPAPPAATKAADDETKPDEARTDAEALDKAKPKPEKKPVKLAKATPRHRTRQASTALARLSGASPLPDYAFARPTKKSPVYGGNEDSRYLAIVYGMIMMHRQPIDLGGEGGGSVTIDFTVDDSGNVIGIGLERSSGNQAIDTAAVTAIRRASPFPPPPAGSPRGLVATIDFSEGAPSYTMGSQDP